MKSIQKYAIAVFAVLLLGSANIFSQEFKELNLKQLGEKVNIEYSIIGEQLGQLFNVSPTYSVDGGKTFLPMKSVTGNVGRDVTGGRYQVVIWDVLKDAPSLQGDVIFKLTGNTQATQPLEDDFSRVEFKLISLHRVDNNQLELILSITNHGDPRDLKLINGLITITDFNKRNYDAQRGKLGDVVGAQRYSTPQLTMQNGETVQASFTFDHVPADVDRVMKLSIGAELLTISRFGLDNLEIGTLQFRDFPVSGKPTSSMTTTVTKRFQSTITAKLNIQKPTVVEVKKDVKAPIISVIMPEGVTLIGNEATRGRPYAQSSAGGLDDRRLRSVGGDNELTVTEDNLLVRGVASDENGIFEVVVNGKNANLKLDGTFEATVALKMGRNDIIIRAMNIFEKSVERRFIIHRKDSPNQKVASDTEELDLIFDAPRAPKYYALIVGVNEYPDPSIASLDKPIRDAVMLGKVLVDRYVFNSEDVVFLKNPTRSLLIDELDRFTRRVTKDDNLLIFFAGHGYYDPETEFGYWLPSDAVAQSTGNWIANSQLRDYIAAIKSKHTLLITDACFGGGIFKTRKAFADATDQLNKVYDKKSRKAMTSGSLTEVPDESVFLRLLVQRLEENTMDYLSAEELFSSFKTAVMNGSPTVPMYGDIKGTGDEGGDFVFVKR